MKEQGFSLDPKDTELLNDLLKKLIRDDADVEKFERIINSGDFIKIILQVTNSELSEHIYNTIKKNSKKNLAIKRSENQEFEERINSLWKEPFELFETLIYISQEIGDEFNQEFRPNAVRDNDLVFEALIRLHGRACQTALEISALMQKGFPEGAIARWRTLHEIVVIGYFIQKNGQDSAERYLLHDAIESYNSIEKYIRKPDIYKKHKQALSEPLLSMNEMKATQRIKIKLCEKYGKKYETDYGWAANIISDPNFSKIEEYVNVDHLHPYYKMANISVHGGSKGINFFLSSPNKNVIPAGPGNMGMTDPGQLAAISLFQMNTILLLSKPSIYRMAEIAALKKLLNRIKRSFGRVHKQTMKRYRELNEKESKG